MTDGLQQVLVVENLSAGYGGPPIIHDVNLSLRPGEVVAVIGPNGSGKSTFLKSLVGGIQPEPGSRVTVFGTDITAASTHRRAVLGVGYVPQVNDTFGPLSVRENLEIGGFRLRRHEVRQRIVAVCELFPALKPMMRRRVDTLSGGERRMVGIGRAWMSSPKLVLLDEPTAGLSPHVGERVLIDAVSALVAMDVAIVLVEQRAEEALKVSDQAMVFVEGAVAEQGSVAEVTRKGSLGKLFLSGSQSPHAAAQS